MTAVVIARGLQDFSRFIDALPELATEAAYLAINDTSRAAVPLIKSEMRKQINFPNGYLNKQRLDVRRKATRVTLEAVISGRDRPTSLARFAEGATPENSRRRPIFVRVHAGQQKRLQKAFIVRLKNNNLGLAIRLPKGQEPDRAYKPVELTRGGGKGQGAWLLYGPSVDQVMQGVSGDVGDRISEALAANFLRQFSRVSNRG